MLRGPSLPTWLLLLSTPVFIGTWLLAPQESFSGQNEPSGILAPRPRPAPPLASALELRPAFPPTSMPRGPEVDSVKLQPYRIALTFDDGPHHLHTARLLQILERYQVPAALFVNGCWLEPGRPHFRENRALLQRAQQSGHLIGSHSYSHPDFSRLTVAEQEQEILENERILLEVLGMRPSFFRLPYAVKTDQYHQLLRQHGYVEALWTATAPEGEISDPAEIRDELLRWILHFNGGIVMLHDRNRHSVEAVGLLLQALKAENCRRLRRGTPILRIVPLDSLLSTPQKFTPLVGADGEGEQRHLQQLRRICVNM